MNFKRSVLAKYQITANPAFMSHLNQTFAGFMQDESIQKQVLKEAEDYRDDRSDDELLDFCFSEIYPAWMEDLENRGKFEGDGIRLFRGISAKHHDKIDTKKIGIFWTWDKKKAANYSDENTKDDLFIYEALAKAEDLKLKETFLKMVWPGYDHEESEREFELKDGRKLKLLSLSSEDGKNITTDIKEIST